MPNKTSKKWKAEKIDILGAEGLMLTKFWLTKDNRFISDFRAHCNYARRVARLLNEEEARKGK